MEERSTYLAAHFDLTDVSNAGGVSVLMKAVMTHRLNRLTAVSRRCVSMLKFTAASDQRLNGRAFYCRLKDMDPMYCGQPS